MLSCCVANTVLHPRPPTSHPLSFLPFAVEVGALLQKINAIVPPQYFTRCMLFDIRYLFAILALHCILRIVHPLYSSSSPFRRMSVSLDSQLVPVAFLFISPHTASLATALAHCDISTIYHRTHSLTPLIRIAQHRHSHPHVPSPASSTSTRFYLSAHPGPNIGLCITNPLVSNTPVILAFPLQPVLSLHTHHIP
ncbi:hypothetical protein C8T65DRAFT_222949 [Cerioporus squamosus]|nr:hypothetical protein C8T65DRAFT_222949 [Cerioporus squamosus]